MSYMTIDLEKCNKDGICVDECPMKIIYMEDEVPKLLPGGAKMCIKCGHCVGVCPTAALTIGSIKPEDCLEVDRKLSLDPVSAEQFLRSRRSIRSYKDKAVERETIEKLIDIACHAPSGHNSQSVKWQVIHDRSEVKRYSGMVVDWMRYMIKEQPDFAKSLHLDLVVAGWEFGMDTVSRDAPHLILANGNKNNIMGKVTCTIAMTYLELALPSFGLGGCWNGFFNVAAMNWPPLQEALGLGDDTLNHGVMMVGHPKYKYHRMPPRNEADITWK